MSDAVAFARQVLAMDDRIRRLEHDLAHLRRILVQAVLTHGGKLRIDPALSSQVTGNEELLVGIPDGHVSLSQFKVGEQP